MFNEREREYIFQAIENKDRELELYKAASPHFRQVFTKVLDEYGLAARLEQAQATGQQAAILDWGCSEGLYLHDVARLLEERGLLKTANLLGIDKNPTVIATAEEYARLAKPPRPYLRFYTQDGTQPLIENPELRAAGTTKFDFIFCLVTLMYQPQAQNQLAKIYRDDLKPGGVIYLHDLVTSLDIVEMGTPHPALRPILQFYCNFVNSLNPGVSVAKEAGQWLRDLGAEQVEIQEDVARASAENTQQLSIMRNIILMGRSIGQQMVGARVMTQAEYDNILAKVYRELDRDSYGTLVYMDTLARKPAE